MGIDLSPMLLGELANLDKGVDSHKSSMKALKSYIKDLDAKAIPLFLAEVSENLLNFASGEDIISLYDVLVRAHGVNVVPHIDNIMMTIVKALKLGAGSVLLHQACSKVVSAIAKYGIDTSTPDGEKATIIRSLCIPLCDVLMCPSENVASAAALCLKALVESDGWRFAPDDVINDVCLRAVGALEERLTQTNIHMGLAMALAKHNSLTIEAFARSLILSGLQIVTAGNSTPQKRLSAIQMINFLMKCVDSRSIFSELVTIIDVMESCHKDQMPFVRGAAFEALQTAKMVATKKGSKILKDSSPITGSNVSKRTDNGRMRNVSSIRVDGSRCGSRSPTSLSSGSQTRSSFGGFDSMRNVSGTPVDGSSCGSRSPRSLSPESRTISSFSGFDSIGNISGIRIDGSSCGIRSPRPLSAESRTISSFSGFDSFTDSSLSTGQASCNFEYDRPANQSLWKNENGSVDVSLKDCLYSEVNSGCNFSETCSEHFDDNELRKTERGCSQPFTGYVPESPTSIKTQGITLTPQKLQTELSTDNIGIFTTPRKLMHFLQDEDECDLELSEEQGQNVRGLMSCKVGESSMTKISGIDDSRSLICVVEGKNFASQETCVTDDALGPDDFELVSSTSDASLYGNGEVVDEVNRKEKNSIESANWKIRSFRKVSLSLVCGIALVLPAVIFSTLWPGNEEECFNLVPT